MHTANMYERKRIQDTNFHKSNNKQMNCVGIWFAVRLVATMAFIQFRSQFISPLFAILQFKLLQLQRASERVIEAES